MTTRNAQLLTLEPGMTGEETARHFFPDLAPERFRSAQVGRWTLAGFDLTPEEWQRTVSEFNPADLFDDDCPLCRMMREEGGVIIVEGVTT